MDKIYSRRRIKLFYLDNKKSNKKVKIILIIIIAFFTAFVGLKSVDPIFDSLCIEKANSLAEEITGESVKEVLSMYECSNIVTVTKNEEDGTNILKTDVAVINKIATEIGRVILERLNKLGDENIKIPIGAITGNKYVSGLGPKVKIKVTPVGNLKTELKTEFESQGINQTIYRVYLNIECKINVITSYKVLESLAENRVLLVETVVVGGVPTTYYNLDDLEKENILDIIE